MRALTAVLLIALAPVAGADGIGETDPSVYSVGNRLVSPTVEYSNDNAVGWALMCVDGSDFLTGTFHLQRSLATGEMSVSLLDAAVQQARTGQVTAHLRIGRHRVRELRVGTARADAYLGLVFRFVVTAAEARDMLRELKSGSDEIVYLIDGARIPRRVSLPEDLSLAVDEFLLRTSESPT